MFSLISNPLLLVLTPVLAQDETGFSASYESRHVSPVFWIIEIAFIILMIASMWKVFVKAGHPGWASIIPIYNLYVLCKVAGRPGWWLLLMLIPFVNLIIFIILDIDIAKNFGKGAGFGIGLLLLPFIFFPILGFGSAQYQGSAGSNGVPPLPATA